MAKVKFLITRTFHGTFYWEMFFLGSQGIYRKHCKSVTIFTSKDMCKKSIRKLASYVGPFEIEFYDIEKDYEE